MKLRTPHRASVLWFVGTLIALAVFPLLMYGGNLYYAEGGKSPDAPGMLLISVMMTSPIWGSGWLVFIAMYLVRYTGGAPVLTGTGQTFPSILLSFVAIAVSVFFLWCLFARVDFWKPSRLPFIMFFSGCAVYVQYLRAAAVARSRGRAVQASDRLA